MSSAGCVRFMAISPGGSLNSHAQSPEVAGFSPYIKWMTLPGTWLQLLR